LSLKAVEWLKSLDPEDVMSVIGHSAHRANVKRVDKLIRLLRDCRQPGDFYEFQRQLFDALYQVEKRRSQCHRIVRRFEQRRDLPADCPPHPHSGDPTKIESWELERYVFAQLARQLRTVGDGLAWRCFGYDRRVILALSRNDSPGPLYDKEGLQYEIDQIEQIWNESGSFALLHDLTNCLRIADLTEFTTDRGALFHEIKKKAGTNGRTERKQLKRIQAAIDSIMKDGPLPGDQVDARFVSLTQPHTVNLRQLNEILQLAKKHGARGARLPQGRALVAMSLLDTMARWKDDGEGALRAYESTRARVIRRAGIETATHHIIGVSGDSAARSPIMAPWSIYPFAPEDCAALICNLLSFQSILSANALADSLTAVGLHAELLLQPGDGPLSGAKEIIRASLNSRSITLQAQGLNVLLYELLEPDVWAQGIREALRRPNIPSGPALIFADEARSWFQF
jgi:hypothetical protein